MDRMISIHTNQDKFENAFFSSVAAFHRLRHNQGA